MAWTVLFCVILVMAAMGYISFWWLVIPAIPFILFVVLSGVILAAGGNVKVKRRF